MVKMGVAKPYLERPLSESLSFSLKDKETWKTTSF